MRIAAIVTVSACLVGSLSACSARDDGVSDNEECSAGFTDSKVTFGSSVARSGPAAAVGVIADAGSAYFDEINKAGGVEMADGKKREIEFKVLDDGYDPARTVSNVRRLVGRDQVFAIHSMTGTGPVLAVSDYAKQQQVPIVFPVSGSSEFGALVKDGVPIAGVSQPDISWEAQLWVEHAVKADPKAKFAILYPSDGFGKAGANGAKSAMAKAGVDLVASQDYEPTAPNLDSQVARLKDSGATVLLSLASASFQTQALKRASDLGWFPNTYIPATSSDVNIVKSAGGAATKNLYATAWLRDVSNAADTSPGMKTWRTFAEENDIDSTSSLAAIGYTNAQFAVKALESMRGCTRKDFLNAVQGAKDLTPALGVEGVQFEAIEGYPNIITGLALVKFDGSHWETTGDTYQR